MTAYRITPEIHQALMRALRSSTKFLYFPRAQVDRSRNGQDPQGLDAQHESAVVADDAPITGMGKSDQEGA